MDDDFLQGEISSLTDLQEITMSLVTIVSATLSILGSSAIIYRVLKGSGRSAKCYDRIMLGLSSFDILSSISYGVAVSLVIALIAFYLSPTSYPHPSIIASPITLDHHHHRQPFLLPKESSQRVWARGNHTSCLLLGWMTQLSLGTVTYNCLLSFYFLLKIKYSMTASDFESQLEPYFHILTIFFFLFTATAGVVFDIFAEVELGYGCWGSRSHMSSIAEFPEGCEARGDCIGHYIGWIWGALPVAATFICLPINNLQIYCYIKKALKTPENSQSNHIQAIHTRRVATQGTLYVVTFFLSYTATFLLRILEGVMGYGSSDEATIYWLLLLNAFLQPLQGFFNMIVFVRPNYIRLKEAGLSTGLAIRGAILETDLPKFMSQHHSHDHYRAHQTTSINNGSRSVSLDSYNPLLPVVSEAEIEDSKRSNPEVDVEDDEGSTEEYQNSFEDEPLT